MRPDPERARVNGAITTRFFNFNPLNENDVKSSPAIIAHTIHEPEKTDPETQPIERIRQ
jgi:hypothetical protein